MQEGRQPEIDFEKMRGLAPAIVQDAANGEVLMLGIHEPRCLRAHPQTAAT